MIVVDSSVWIANLKRLDTVATRKLIGAVQDSASPPLIGDIVLLEVLKGARDATHAAVLEQQLRQFPVVAMLGEALVARAAANYRFLRQKGITLRGAMDLVIGTFCIEHGHQLLHDDRDFHAMNKHLGLQFA